MTVLTEGDRGVADWREAFAATQVQLECELAEEGAFFLSIGETDDWVTDSDGGHLPFLGRINRCLRLWGVTEHNWAESFVGARDERLQRYVGRDPALRYQAQGKTAGDYIHALALRASDGTTFSPHVVAEFSIDRNRRCIITASGSVIAGPEPSEGQEPIKPFEAMYTLAYDLEISQRES